MIINGTNLERKEVEYKRISEHICTDDRKVIELVENIYAFSFRDDNKELIML